MTSLNKDGVELLPCPFCGGTARIDPRVSGTAEWFVISCEGICGCVVEGMHVYAGALNSTKTARDKASTAWNRRAPSSPAHEGGEVVASEALPDRLRSLVPHLQGEYPPHVLSDLGEAADALEASQARIAELDEESRLSMETIAFERSRAERAEAALKPFAELAPIFDFSSGTRPSKDEDAIMSWNDHRVEGERRLILGHLRAARKALQHNGGGE